MPSEAMQIRRVCGCFLPVYIGFMSKRAKKKLTLRIAMLTLKRKVDGAVFGLLLSYLFWGSLLLRCGDVESNPGPNPPIKESMRQTRLSSAGASHRVSLEKAGDTRASRASASQPDPEPTLGDILMDLRSMREEMGTKLDGVKKEMREIREDFADLRAELKDLKEEVIDLRKENKDLQRTNTELSAKLLDCEARIDDLEGRSKRNNLLFYGIPRRENETNEGCEGLLRDLFIDKLDMTSDVELDRVHRLNSRPDSPIIARCVFYKQKVDILKRKSKLKGQNIFIGEDFSRSVRDIRRRLTPYLKKSQAGREESSHGLQLSAD